jgi:hypothetical protein
MKRKRKGANDSEHADHTAPKAGKPEAYQMRKNRMQLSGEGSSAAAPETHLDPHDREPEEACQDTQRQR